MNALARLPGQRILVVEDDMMIALHVEKALQDMGCVVIGPVGKLDVALELARSERLDAAILDVTIRGGRTFPVAEQLMSRGVPFVFASGYGDWALPDAFRNQPRLTKPFTIRDLSARVQALCSRPTSVPAAAGLPA